MTIAELIVALLFAKYGGALIQNDHPGEKPLGWIFLLAGLALAFIAGRSW